MDKKIHAKNIELLDHSFFFFRSKDSDQYNVLYRRHDDSYGLIEPELD